MGPILIASGNRHKHAEIERILRAAAPGARLPFALVRPGDLRAPTPPPTPREDGASYRENAAIKARAFRRWSGLPALADDSGLEVEALGGAPGLISSRYAGEEGNAPRNIAKLLAALHDRPREARRARFVCALVLARDDGTLLEVEEACEGEILAAPRGGEGFGYDPVFLPQGSARSFAEMTDEEKDAVSHRGRALRALFAILAAALAAPPGRAATAAPAAPAPGRAAGGSARR